MNGDIQVKFRQLKAIKLKNMTELIDVLPGIELPVGAVSEELSKIWGGNEENALSEFRASQMNLVLHFGRTVSPLEVKARFEVAVRFAQRYPSRIIVLCPFYKDNQPMQAKLFSQCFIGDSHREMCCCEALILGFSSENNGFLFNQVSVWLESDLPIYHWFSEVRADRVVKYFDHLLKRVHRIVFDSNIESYPIRDLPWPNSKKVVDLARARLLPVRQAIGQYLSGIPFELLRKELCSIYVYFVPKRKGDAFHLMQWLLHSLKCIEDTSIDSKLIELKPNSNKSLCFEMIYDHGQSIQWTQFKDTSISHLSQSLGGTDKEFSIQIKPLLPEQELSEAFYF
ncbi:glucose-6-phosphate dehydrogenase assembly protein OpcA [Opitutae bacterium]|nr:glucose-6-phosphate dehydrogenase assembly protein OpcA [Opitutae bacterium]